MLESDSCPLALGWPVTRPGRQGAVAVTVCHFCLLASGDLVCSVFSLGVLPQPPRPARVAPGQGEGRCGAEPRRRGRGHPDQPAPPPRSHQDQQSPPLPADHRGRGTATSKSAALPTRGPAARIPTCLCFESLRIGGGLWHRDKS